ncbi:DUF5659 domain-containing protein [Paenibacillus sp. FSL M8-0334]|uniref:DUF5659 domain-containing protein n=1 Tax=Paenibacillus sp. FSL M8-0334 TaxID=2921623 RepID=UPI0040468A0E
MKYIYDINLVSFLLLNGVKYEGTEINTANCKLKFLFKQSELLNALIQNYKSSAFKNFVQYQNQVRKVVHSSK